MQGNELIYKVLMEGVSQAVSGLNSVMSALKKLEAATNSANNVNQKSATTQSKVASAMGQSALQATALASATDKTTQATDKKKVATDKASKSQENYMLHIAKTTVLSAAVNKGFMVMVESMGLAVEQADLISNFPASMGALGLSTTEASDGFAKLKTYVQSVGGDLAKASNSVTRFAGVNRDVKASVAIFAGLNNALIAGGGNAVVQASALEQMTQAYSRGRPQLIEWKSALVAMAPQLDQVAKKMGYVNAGALGTALTTGEQSMNSFMTTLAQMGTGTGPIANQALIKMQGIGFAMTVLKNTITNSLTAIYLAIGRQNIVAVFTFITQVIQTLAQWIVVLINLFMSLFSFINKMLGGPGFKQLAADTGGVAANLNDGVDAADNLGDSLGGAGESAKELNKSLASFDKMNVLADKTSASGGGAGGGSGAGAGGGGAGPLSAIDTGILDGIFDNMNSKLKEASTLAKIFAGILAGMAGAWLFTKGVNDIVKFSNALKTAGGWAKNLKTALAGSVDESGKKINSFAQNLPIVLTGSFGKVGKAAVSLGRFLTNPYVLAAAVIIAVITATIWLYNTNKEFKKGFDSVWGPIVETIKTVAKVITENLGKAFAWLGKTFMEMTKPIKPVFDWIAKVFGDFVNWIKDVAKQLGLLNAPMETLGKVMGAIFVWFGAILLGPIAIAIAAIGIAVAIVIGIVMAIVAVFKFIWDVIAGFIDWLVSAWNASWNLVKTVVTNFGKWIGDFWKGTVKVFTDAWNGVASFFTDLWEGVKVVFNAVWKWLQEWGLTVLAVLLWPYTLLLAVVINVVAAIVSFFTWLWAQIVAIWSVVATWFASIFQVAWDGIVLIWSVVTAWFQAIWDSIVAIFTVVATWFGQVFSDAWEAIKTVWNVVASWFDTTVIQPIIAFYSPIVEWFRKLFSDAWEGIKNIWSAVAGWFGGVWNNIVGVFSGVAQWFSGIFQNAWNNITNVFSNLWSWFKTNVWDKIVSVFSSIGTVIGDAVSGAFKGVINTVLTVVIGIINTFFGAINWAIDTINKIPGVSIKKVPTIPVPKLARGGVVDQPTMAMVGEAGSEAVVPLENNTEWIDKLAAKINTAGGSGQPMQLTVQIGEERIVTKIIDLINEKTQMSGRNVIYV